MLGGEIVIFDQPEPCPYLNGRVARMPLRRPLTMLDAIALDAHLAVGDRRCGEFLYRTHCPRCSACEPIRVPVDEFQPRTTQRRILRHGDRRLRMEIDIPTTDDARVDLFNRHRFERDLEQDTGSLDHANYSAFLEDTCCTTREISYYLNDRLVAVAITDIGSISLNAVYCYYDPTLTGFSFGTYSILKQIELCRAWNKRYLYLGLYIAESQRMSYKANFRPHERLLNETWQRFD